jgi:hypothetical protein
VNENSRESFAPFPTPQFSQGGYQAKYFSCTLCSLLSSPVVGASGKL